MEVPAAPGLDREVVAVWLTTKAMQLEPSLALANTEELARLVAARTE